MGQGLKRLNSNDSAAILDISSESSLVAVRIVIPLLRPKSPLNFNLMEPECQQGMIIVKAIAC